MSRRRHSDEIAFGSDSFLDILANIVGILIILIVIAGVRMIHTPSVVSNPASQVADDAALAAAPAVAPLPVDDAVAPLGASLRFPSRACEEAEPIEQPPIPEPPPLSQGLVNQVTSLEQDINALNQRRGTISAQQHSLAAEHQAVRQRLAETNHSAAALRATFARDQQMTVAQQQLLNAKQQQLAKLQVALADTETQQPPTTVLKHDVNPIGRELGGQQLQILLSGGRVAVVPTEELLTELKASLKRKRDQILRTKRYVGSIGPVQGFQMEYVVERLPTSLFAEPQMGASLYRSDVTEFSIEPLPDVQWETAAFALDHNSRFLAALRRVGYGATVLAWVYPDSFALYRDLKEYAHEQGFAVAASPQPEGVPLRLSPYAAKWNSNHAQ